MSDQINYGMSVTQGGKRIDPMSIYKEPEQSTECGEPVAWRAWVSKFPQGTGSDWVYVTKPIMKDRIHNQPLYTTPPQRKPLTDEEIKSIFEGNMKHDISDAFGFARAIEAAHGIKAEA